LQHAKRCHNEVKLQHADMTAVDMISIHLVREGHSCQAFKTNVAPQFYSPCLPNGPSERLNRSAVPLVRTIVS
jgi:hypothetical protein